MNKADKLVVVYAIVGMCIMFFITNIRIYDSRVSAWLGFLSAGLISLAIIHLNESMKKEKKEEK